MWQVVFVTYFSHPSPQLQGHVGFHCFHLMNELPEMQRNCPMPQVTLLDDGAAGADTSVFLLIPTFGYRERFGGSGGGWAKRQKEKS